MFKLVKTVPAVSKFSKYYKRKDRTYALYASWYIKSSCDHLWKWMPREKQKKNLSQFILFKKTNNL